MHFTVIAKDATDKDVLSRRLAARAEHLEGVARLQAEGKLILGAALLNEAGEMCGSLMVFDAPSKTELENWLQTDTYTRNTVWGSIEITACKVAPCFLAHS